jgi:hypothetical protein
VVHIAFFLKENFDHLEQCRQMGAAEKIGQNFQRQKLP